MHGIVAEGFRYDVGVTTTFDSGKLDDPTTGIRSAHQEGSEANARNLAVYGALNYRRPGLLLGGGVFTGDTGQNGASNPALQGVAARLPCGMSTPGTAWQASTCRRCTRRER
jgi:hypothetical protein